jgi:hypothetical protein
MTHEDDLPQATIRCLGADLRQLGQLWAFSLAVDFGVVILSAI